MVEPGDPTAAPRFRSPLALSAWSVAAAFGAYFCSYGFRKPFTAGAYSGSSLGGLDYKVVLVVAQVLGYMVSKFIGIRVVAEMRPERRVTGILLLIALAWLALLVFAVLPPPFAAAMLFLNGLALGMVFGLVLSFLEGRRVTEALAAGLCASLILADSLRRSHFQRCPRREPSALSTVPHRIRMPQPRRPLAARPTARSCRC